MNKIDAAAIYTCVMPFFTDTITVRHGTTFRGTDQVVRDHAENFVQLGAYTDDELVVEMRRRFPDYQYNPLHR